MGRFHVSVRAQGRVVLSQSNGSRIFGSSVEIVSRQNRDLNLTIYSKKSKYLNLFKENFGMKDGIHSIRHGTQSFKKKFRDYVAS